MANCKSAKKRIITNKKRQERNSAKKSKLKTLIQKVKKDITEKAKTKEDSLKAAVKYIDKMSAQGILHKNNAARKKSNLTKASNKAA